ncbi:hypothetical protein J8F10_16745 [Gemmata sp. G18]|uniref:Uncharacterized protein n=1 Tax=Gemmata palustris TaxID=2822762 RepID=A0ABS5BTE6_9BACT|nr:hypothetical protein [Gemmata palustris]MBP3956921.1 hypothetical protein [Gemmata palustris]
MLRNSPCRTSPGVAHQREIVIQHEMDGIVVVNKGLDASGRIVVDGVRPVRDGEKVEYEFRKPEPANPKKPLER